MEESLIEQNRVFSRIWEYARENKFTVEDKEFYLALSGGRDSLCAFYFFLYLQTQFPVRWTCVHFQHGLRGKESDLDEQFCEKLCAKFGVPLSVHILSFPNHSNFQDQARAQRMKVLKSVAASSKWDGWVVTGHHLDDHLESILIGMHQGRWDQRLEPIRIINEKYRIFRPLADVSRKEITYLLKNLRLPWREDSSNRSKKYLRNYYRFSPILTRSGEDLRRISLNLEEMNSKERAFFTDFVIKQARFRPHTLMGIFLDENDFRLKGEVEFPLCRFKCFSEERFQAFWFWLIRVLCPSALKELDVKRLRQVFLAKPDRKKRFSLSKMRDVEMEFSLTRDWLIFQWNLEK